MVMPDKVKKAAMIAIGVPTAVIVLPAFLHPVGSKVLTALLISSEIHVLPVELRAKSSARQSITVDLRASQGRPLGMVEEYSRYPSG